MKKIGGFPRLRGSNAPKRGTLAHFRDRSRTPGTVTDVLKEGDIVDVKVLDVDRQGKMRLSRKSAWMLPKK